MVSIRNTRNSKNIDIPVDYATPKREWIDRDSKRRWNMIKGNLYNKKIWKNKTL